MGFRAGSWTLSHSFMPSILLQWQYCIFAGKLHLKFNSGWTPLPILHGKTKRVARKTLRKVFKQSILPPPPYLCYGQRTQIWRDSAVCPMDTWRGKTIYCKKKTVCDRFGEWISIECRVQSDRKHVMNRIGVIMTRNFISSRTQWMLLNNWILHFQFGRRKSFLVILLHRI